MKDLLDMAKTFSAMSRATENGGVGESPLSAIADVAHLLASINEQLVILNRNLEAMNKDKVNG